MSLSILARIVNAVTDQATMRQLVQQSARAGIQIDDPMDVEDRLIRQMVRRHVAFRQHHATYYLGDESLPLRWQRLTQQFTNEDAALQFLKRAVRRDDLPRLRAMHLVDEHPGVRLTNEEVLASVAHALFSRRIWILNRNRFPPPVKADSAVFAALNTDARTKVNFDFLAQWEGGQHLHGYVPFSGSTVAGNSGVTIATGFDIGQKSANQLRALNLTDDLLARLQPFAGKKFKNKTREQVITDIALLGAPVPVITVGEANLLDKLIHAEHLNAAVKSWNDARKPGVPAFSDLPVPWQTVLFSRTFHQGVGFPKKAISKKFYDAATAGQWDTAVRELRNYAVAKDWYKKRVQKEAEYLGTEMPPAVVSPPPTTVPRPVPQGTVTPHAVPRPLP